MTHFLESIEGTLGSEELRRVIDVLNCGYGKIDGQLVYEHQLRVWDSKG